MNMFNIAMQMELEGEKNYQKLAENSSSAGLKKIFFMLANEEFRHHMVIEQLKRQLGSMHLAPTKILGNVKTVFQEMKGRENRLRFAGPEDPNSFIRLRDYEMNCRDFYLEQADQLHDIGQQRIFLQLAGEENKHLRIMKNIVELTSWKEPGNWLENARWRYLDGDEYIPSDT
jgi:rubrerythrin